jgi:hypothetical protein
MSLNLDELDALYVNRQSLIGVLEWKSAIGTDYPALSARIRELEADINRRDSANTAMLNKMFELQAERDALQGQVAAMHEKNYAAEQVIHSSHVEAMRLREVVATIKRSNEHMRNLAIEECKRFIDNGSFMHDQAPTRLFANEVIKGLDTLKTGEAK